MSCCGAGRTYTTPTSTTAATTAGGGAVAKKSEVIRTWRVIYADGTQRDWVGGKIAELMANREAAMNSGSSVRVITTLKEET